MKNKLKLHTHLLPHKVRHNKWMQLDKTLKMLEVQQKMLEEENEAITDLQLRMKECEGEGRKASPLSPLSLRVLSSVAISFSRSLAQRGPLSLRFSQFFTKVEGRFDDVPPRFVTYYACSGGVTILQVELPSCNEDIARKLTMKLPTIQQLYDDGTICFPVISESEDSASDTGFGGRVEWGCFGADNHRVSLRIDNMVKHAFWMQADLSRMYFPR